MATVKRGFNFKAAPTKYLPNGNRYDYSVFWYRIYPFLFIDQLSHLSTPLTGTGLDQKIKRKVGLSGPVNRQKIHFVHQKAKDDAQQIV